MAIIWYDIIPLINIFLSLSCTCWLQSKSHNNEHFHSPYTGIDKICEEKKAQ